MIEGNPYIDYYHFLASRSIKDHIRLGKELAKTGYDTIIDPTIFLRNRDLLLLSMIKANRYIGYKKADYKLFNMDIEGEMHFSEVYKQALLQIFGTSQLAPLHRNEFFWSFKFPTVQLEKNQSVFGLFLPGPAGKAMGFAFISRSNAQTKVFNIEQKKCFYL